MYTYAAYFFMNFKTLIHIQANKGVLGSTHLNLIIHIAPMTSKNQMQHHLLPEGSEMMKMMKTAAYLEDDAPRTWIRS